MTIVTTHQFPPLDHRIEKLFDRLRVESREVIGDPGVVDQIAPGTLTTWDTQELIRALTETYQYLLSAFKVLQEEKRRLQLELLHQEQRLEPVSDLIKIRKADCDAIRLEASARITKQASEESSRYEREIAQLPPRALIREVIEELNKRFAEAPHTRVNAWPNQQVLPKQMALLLMKFEESEIPLLAMKVRKHTQKKLCEYFADKLTD